MYKSSSDPQLKSLIFLYRVSMSELERLVINLYGA